MVLLYFVGFCLVVFFVFFNGTHDFSGKLSSYLGLAGSWDGRWSRLRCSPTVGAVTNDQ